MSISMLPSKTERLEGRLSSVVGVLNRAHAQLVDIAAEALATEAWAGDGISSPTHWLVLRAGLSRSRAAQVLEVARRREELPVTLGALATGELSLEQVGPIARRVPAAYEASVCELARFATVPQIVRATSTEFRTPVAEPAQSAPASVDADAAETEVTESQSSPEAVSLETGASETGSSETEASAPLPSEPMPPEPAPRLSMRHDDAGWFHLQYDAPSDIGALVESAVREATDSLWRLYNTKTAEGDPSETSDPQRPSASDAVSEPGETGKSVRVSLADGLHHLAANRLEGLESPSRRDAYRVYVHLDTDLGWLTGRPCLPRHIVDRLTCDAKLRPVWHTDGVPVSVGRSQRTVPRHTRRLVLDRDRGCRYPGCASTRHLEVHHIVHWILGGLTDLDNLVALCPRHHAAHHRGEFTIAGDPNLPDADPADDPRPGERSGLRFTTANGLPVRYTAPAAVCRPLPDGPAYAGPSGDRLESHWVTFDARPGTGRGHEDLRTQAAPRRQPHLQWPRPRCLRRRPGRLVADRPRSPTDGHGAATNAGRLGTVGLGTVRLGTVRLGTVGLGTVRLGTDDAPLGNDGALVEDRVRSAAGGRLRTLRLAASA
ncbi:HNH endonuclease signature motif containing protein [Piscicoccus intestinalis]|uniref:HNH endonuclease signature motif containing protein n=1 Tax=Piscicoccus intestinalis TaxID=746033 RepID=UPI0014705CB7|nr:HNH endonuclease signature motif containing protein [Piscicoccus intestinalis]